MNPVIYCETVDAMKSAVKAGMDIGIFYGNSTETDIRQGELKVIRLPLLNNTIETSIIHHKERPLSPIASAFLLLLRRRRLRTRKETKESQA